MPLIAKHDFKIQVSRGEFVQMHKGDVIPAQYYAKNSPFADFVRDHADGGIIKPTMIVTPEMKRLTELPTHVKEQEDAREAILNERLRLDNDGGQQAIGSVPQKQDMSPKPVPKMEPKTTHHHAAHHERAPHASTKKTHR